MSYLDITEEILRQELRKKAGATPVFTVAAQFSEDKKKGENSRFVRTSRGVYGLRKWQQQGHQPVIDEIEIEPSVTPLGIAVQAYGIYWDRAAVDWKKVSTKLLGQQFENSAVVDLGEQRGIYILFDHRNLVYVGRATAQTLGSRIRDHTLDRLRSRWDRFSWFGFHAVKADGKLEAPGDAKLDLDGVISVLEAVLIELNEPPQNRQQGKGLGGIEYLQRTDPALKNHHKQELLGVLAKAIDAKEEE